MNFAYDWAFANPVRQVGYIVVGLSVVVWAGALALARVEHRWSSAE